MDREHLATIVGRLRGWCDPAHVASANLRYDLIDAAEAIEALVDEAARLADMLKLSNDQVEALHSMLNATRQLNAILDGIVVRRPGAVDVVKTEGGE